MFGLGIEIALVLSLILFIVLYAKKCKDFKETVEHSKKQRLQSRQSLGTINEELNRVRAELSLANLELASKCKGDCEASIEEEVKPIKVTKKPAAKKKPATISKPKKKDNTPATDEVDENVETNKE